MTRKFDKEKQLEIITSKDGFPKIRIPCIDIDTDGTEHECNIFFAPIQRRVLHWKDVFKAARACHELPSGSSIYVSNFNFLMAEIYDSLVERGLSEHSLDNVFKNKDCRMSFFMDLIEFSNFEKILPEFTQLSIDYITSLVERGLVNEEGMDLELNRLLNKQFG